MVSYSFAPHLAAQSLRWLHRKHLTLLASRPAGSCYRRFTAVPANTAEAVSTYTALRTLISDLFRRPPVKIDKQTVPSLLGYKTMQTVLLTVNLLVSLASAGASASALIRPASLSGSNYVERSQRFYARMYAARAIPFGCAAGLIPFWSTGAAVAWFLFTAAFIQALDVVIAAEKKDRRMVTGASIGMIVHLLCGFSAWTRHL